tara:strand:+ start:342 stop:533 length:192 start_codon:yes stop_codon:yes gene_type:complete
MEYNEVRCTNGWMKQKTVSRIIIEHRRNATEWWLVIDVAVEVRFVSYEDAIDFIIKYTKETTS